MIEKIRYRLVYNRKKKLNKQGTALVQIEALLSRRKTYISTKIYLHPCEWDYNHSQVVNHPHANDINAMLYEKIIELQSFEISYWRRGLSPSLLDIKSAALAKIPTDMTFFQFAHRSINISKRRLGTKQNIMATINRMRSFRGDIDFRDINYSYLTDFESHLLDIGLKVNSVGKHLRNIRTLINEAINQNYLSFTDYPFRKFKIKRETPEHRVLSVKELAIFERYQPKSAKQRHILSAFLFCCYTGLRYSDFCQLKSDNLISIRGNLWIDLKSIKTGIHQRIPVYLLFQGKAIDILNHFPDVTKLVCIGCNADANRKLRQLCLDIGIKKRVTWHTARHTFATLLLSQGVPITTIQRLLGHTSVKTTQVYSEVLDDTIVSDLKKQKNRR